MTWRTPSSNWLAGTSNHPGHGPSSAREVRGGPIAFGQQQGWRRLKWIPQVPLDEGLKKTIDWIRRHMDYYTPGVYRV